VLLGFGSIFSSIAAQALGGGQALLTATIILLAILEHHCGAAHHLRQPTARTTHA
jgi:hypothetical protein